MSVWLSVDSMSGIYPEISPYAFCINNPIIFTDPNGEKVVPGGTTKKEQRRNARQIRKAKRRAIRNGDTEFLERFKSWEDDPDKEYYVYREKGATELERSEANEGSAEDQYYVFYDIKRRGKKIKSPVKGYFTDAQSQLRSNIRNRSNYKQLKWGVWFEWDIEQKPPNKLRLPFGLGVGNYRKYNIWGGKRKSNPHRPMATDPTGIVIKWKTNSGLNWIGLIYRSNFDWTKEKKQSTNF